MKVFFIVGSGIGNLAETIPAFNLAKKTYDDITVVNAESYNLEATRVIFKNLAPVLEIFEVKPEDADLQIGTYFGQRKLKELPRAYTGSLAPGMSEVEFNMISTGLPVTDEDYAEVGECLAYIEPAADAPDIIIHDGFNKKNTGKMGDEKWRAKSYLHWDKVTNKLKARGLRVGSIGSADELIPGTEDLTGLKLEDSIAMLKGAKVVLCNDTGTYHLCNLIKQNSVVVFTFTNDIKNYDERFHKYSELIRSDVPCSPCQGKGRNYWYFNKPNCGWECRGAVNPSRLEEAALDTILKRSKEM